MRIPGTGDWARRALRTLGACPARSLRATGARTSWRSCWSASRSASGCWQYDAWQAHRAAEAADLTHAEPVAAGRRDGAGRPVPGRPRSGSRSSVAGTWVPDGTVYVSGREHDGRGRLLGGHPAHRRRHRRRRAAGRARLGRRRPTTPPRRRPGAAELDAWLQPPEGTGEVDADPTDDVLPQLRIADVIQHVDQDLYGAYASSPTERDAGPGSSRRASTSCPRSGAFTGIRNLLYAIEWWFFGLFAAFIWWRWVTETTGGRAAPATPADAAATPDP